MNFVADVSTDLTAYDYAEISENWWVRSFIGAKGARPSGLQQHMHRGEASAQMRHPPVKVNKDGSKSDGKGR